MRHPCMFFADLDNLVGPTLHASTYGDGVVINGLLGTVYNIIESSHRSARAEVTKYDETMEVFRQHVYSLRRLILNGTVAQTNDIMRRYFQVG